MIVTEFIQDIRSELNEPVNSGLVTDHQLVALLNRSQDLIYTKVVESDQNYFEDSDQSIGFIANQEEYQLPAKIWDRKISRITRMDLSMPKQLTPIRFQEKERYHAANVFLSGSDTDGDVYYLRDNFLGLKPTPKFTYTPNGTVNQPLGLGNILVHFIRKLPELHVAEALNPTSTTFTIPSTAGRASTLGTGVMRAGRCSTEPNHYVGCRLRFIGSAFQNPPPQPGFIDGDNTRGAEVTVTAFNVQTKQITFTPALSFSTLGYASFPVYVVLSQIPVEHHDLMYQYVVMRVAKMKGDVERYGAARAVFNDLWMGLINTIEPRRYDENQHVRTPIDQHFD